MLRELGYQDDEVYIILQVLHSITEEGEGEGQQQREEGESKEPVKVLTIDIMMKGLNTKKDYSKKPPPKYAYNVNPKEQKKKDTLYSINVLSLNSRGLDRLSECISFCSNLQVLHIYENNLESLDYLEKVPMLRILNAQNNRIRSADCLEAMDALEKLNLDHNCLASLPVLPRRLSAL